MASLSKNQVEVIVTDVLLARITFSHLADDLIDHICCEVETEMEGGKSFSEAYEGVRSLFGLKELQKIQENTRYLIDKNYRIMKTTMKVSGLVSLILLGLATVFKVFHWPGAAIGFVLGFFIMCALFLPTAIYLNYRDSHKKKNLLLHLSAFFGTSIFVAGVLFKIMHWPGAGFMVLIGGCLLLGLFLPVLLFVNLKKAVSKKEKAVWILGYFALSTFELSLLFKIMHWPGAGVLMVFGALLLFCVFLPLYSYRKFKETGNITGQYIFLIITSMFAILFTFLLAINTSKDVLGNFVRQCENSQIIINYKQTQNEKEYTAFSSQPDSLRAGKDSSLTILKTSTSELCAFIADLKTDLVMLTDGIEIGLAKEKIKNPAGIIAKDNVDVVEFYMLGENNTGKASMLKIKIEKYKEIVSGLSGQDPKLKALLDKALNTGDVPIEDMKLTWEQNTFSRRVIISVLNVLSEIEISVRQLESETMHLIISRNNNL